LWLKHVFKRANFNKKAGFFEDALADFNLIEDKVNQISERWELKMMYKVFRDRARVYALMRKKDKAQECHNKTEELINDYFPEVLPNIKIGKLRLLKSIWMSKFD
jgi:hypothetical protein